MNELNGLRQQEFLARVEVEVFADHLDQLRAKSLARGKQVVIQRMQLGQVLGKVILIENF